MSALTDARRPRTSAKRKRTDWRAGTSRRSQTPLSKSATRASGARSSPLSLIVTFAPPPASLEEGAMLSAVGTTPNWRRSTKPAAAMWGA